MQIFTVEMVKPLRDSLDMSREEFAAEIGCSAKSVSNWEKGKKAKIQKSLRNAMIRLKNYHEAEAAP